MNCTCKLAAGLLLVGLALPAAADEPDPIEILKKAEAAAKAVTAVAYKAEFHGEGELATRVPRLTGSVRAQRTPGAAVPKLVLEAVVHEPGADETAAFRFINDGSQFVGIDTLRKTVTQQDPPRSLDALFTLTEPAGDLWVDQFFDATLLEAARRGDSVKHEGTNQVNGVDCDVVYVVYRNAAGEARWYFGRKDHLPRRVDQIRSGGILVVALSDLDVKPKLDADTFAVEFPDGYRVRRLGLLPVGSPAPNWTLQTPEGRSVSLESLRGKVVVMDFWATWCTPCKRVMPDVQRLHERFKGRPVAVYGITVRESGDPAKYMKEKGYTYGLLLKGEQITRAYRVKAVPVFYVIGPDGKILFRKLGFDPDDEEKLVKVIEQALSPDG
jgi:thiol-disulfide isomerase/thioredoxin